jgi:hypothetical protein
VPLNLSDKIGEGHLIWQRVVACRAIERMNVPASGVVRTKDSSVTLDQYIGCGARLLVVEYLHESINGQWHPQIEGVGIRRRTTGMPQMGEAAATV